MKLTNLIRRGGRFALKWFAYKLMQIACGNTLQKIRVGRATDGTIVLDVMGNQFDLTQMQATQLGVTLLVESGAVKGVHVPPPVRLAKASPSLN